MFTHVGHVYYNAHSSSPLVVGDFESMRRWPGSPDGSDGFVRFGSGKGAIFDLQLVSADVFVESAHRLVLLAPLARSGWTLADRFGRDLGELQPALTEELSSTWHEDEIEIVSGAIVVAIAYNATPMVGADTSELDERCISDAVPRLPTTAPTTPHYASEPTCAHELAIVPLENGRYRLRIGELHVDGQRVGRCTLDRTDSPSAT